MWRGALALVCAVCFGCDSDSSDGKSLQRDSSLSSDAGQLDAGRADAGRPDGSASLPDGAAGDAARMDAGDAGRSPAADSGGAGEPARPPDAGDEPDAEGPPPGPVRIQIFSRTTGFRHDSIAPARAALEQIAQRRGAMLNGTEDPAVLIARLGESDVVVFLMTTGDVLNAAQQQQFEAYIRAGGGFAGVHSAADTEYDWPFYGELNGAWFKDHPAVQAATIVVDAPGDPLVSFLPQQWVRSDEWYNFRDNPRSRVKVLLRLDESTYTGGNMGADHPIAWTRTIDQGRAFYTGLGHTQESWSEPNVMRHVEEGVFWAAGR